MKHLGSVRVAPLMRGPSSGITPVLDLIVLECTGINPILEIQGCVMSYAMNLQTTTTNGNNKLDGSSYVIHLSFKIQVKRLLHRGVN